MGDRPTPPPLIGDVSPKFLRPPFCLYVSALRGTNTRMQLKVKHSTPKKQQMFPNASVNKVQLSKIYVIENLHSSKKKQSIWNIYLGKPQKKVIFLLVVPLRRGGGEGLAIKKKKNVIFYFVAI